MSKKLIALDLDGVVCDFTGFFLKLLKRETGKPKKLSDWVQTNWDFEDCGTFSKGEVDKAWSKFRHMHNTWLKLQPMPHTSQLAYATEKFNLAFVTSRVATNGLSIREQATEWLHQNFGIEDALVEVAHKKGPIIAELSPFAFIDDKPSNCIEVAEAAPKTRVYILDAPYNQGKFKNVERIKSVNEYLRACDKAK